MDRALFIFRRDLRLEDNTGLLFALEQAKEVVLSFIFSPEQIEHNAYRSDRCLQFMLESLEDLEEQIRGRGGKLYLFQGEPDDVVGHCINALGIDAVVVNRDYTPYSIARDRKIEAVCNRHNTSFHSCEDLLLHPIDQTVKSDGAPYTVFTPYFRNASRLEVDEPRRNRHSRYYSGHVSFAKSSSIYSHILSKREKQQKGGRSACLMILKNLSRFSEYTTIRDFPAEPGTTHLSPHLKFTTCSVREIYHAISLQLGPDSSLIRSLYWRDFFTGIANYFPRVFKGAFKEDLNEINWSRDRNAFQRWCEGETGFPIIDAGMREMRATGFMHNRVRMIAASFLIKDLHVNWQWGEKFFAQSLIDYDPAVNNGNWQWCASTGCDAQPYFRIFNPWSQGAKFDPECLYIKEWVPELSKLPAQMIHRWDQNHLACPEYPAPMVDHAIEAKVALESYRGNRSKKSAVHR